MSTLNKMQTPPTKTEKPNFSSVTFFGNPVLNNLASYLKGVDFAEFLADQKMRELEQQGKANNSVQGDVPNNNAVNVNT